MRVLLLNHLRSMRDCARTCEQICGEVVGEPFDTWREMVSGHAERCENLHDLIAGAAL